MVVSGEISSLKIHENGHIFLKVRDESGEVMVVIFKNVVSKLKEKELACLELNKTMKIEGRVEEYRGNLELVAEEIKCQS